MATNYTAEQVADIIMNDDMGEMESPDSLDEDSSSSSCDDELQSETCSSNDDPSSQSEVDSSSNSDSEFHGRRILLEQRSMRNRPPKRAKTRGGNSNCGRTFRTRGGISKHWRGTVRTRGGVQSCRTKKAAYNSRLQLKETKDNSAEQQNSIMDESAEISVQQHMSMDNINSEESNISIDIAETIAVDKDTGSNNKAGNNKTNNDNWSKEDPVIKTFPFVENTGLKTVVPENDAPFFFFKLLVSDELLNELVQRSNDYALQVINLSHPLCCKSVLNKWKEVTLLEMKKFFGLVFHLGLVAMPSYRAYWSRSRLYKNDMFPSVMSRERFQSIMRFLHFGDEPQQPDDRLAKVRFLINHLNNTMPEIYTPHKELSMDESMMLWRGRLVFRQYIKNKRQIWS